MKSPLFQLIFLFGLFLVFSCSHQQKRLPSSSDEKVVDLTTPSCKDFLDFSVGHIDDKITPFNTDGLVISKNGKILYEFYDGDPLYGGDASKGLYLRDTPHILWSASKTFTATLIGRAIHDMATLPNGTPVTTETKLSTFFPASDEYLKGKNTQFYNDIKIDHLLSMSSNFEWNESYESDMQSSTFLPMLYQKVGNSDMVSYALKSPMLPYGPGNYWNYSGGNSMMMMGILKKIYGDEAYKNLPWTLLFDPLGAENAVFEKDKKGYFIGNSYVYLRPIDMIKFGELYLNNGVYNGKELLSPSWVKESQMLSPSVEAEATPLEKIKAEGIYSKRAFWLNTKAKGYGPDFKNSPGDMYLAGGHYGQFLIILPSQKMVIARTGHDAEYWSKIDIITSKAIACFN